jgi:hypothetical protein
MKVLFSVICVLYLLPSYSQNGSVAEGWKLQKDTAYNFSFLYPVSWDLKLPGTNTRFFVTSKLENDADQFRENLNCIARGLQQQGFKISDATEEIKKSLAEKLTDYKLIYSGYTTWNNVQMLTLEYTCTQESNGVKYYVHLLQKIAVAKGILFTFTYTAAADKYDKFLNTINKILKSVKLN